MIVKDGLGGEVSIDQEKYGIAQPGEYFRREIWITHIMGEGIWMG